MPFEESAKIKGEEIVEGKAEEILETPKKEASGVETPL